MSAVPQLVRDELRFRAYGARQYVTLGTSDEGWTRKKAEAELTIVLAQVERGVWQPPAPVADTPPTATDPTFHEFASEWYDAKRRELRPNTARNYRSDLSLHLLPFFAKHRLSQLTIAEVDRYRQLKVRQGSSRPARSTGTSRCSRKSWTSLSITGTSAATPRRASAGA